MNEEPQNTVEIATEKDLQLIVELQKRFSNQIGFIPRPGLEQHLKKDRVLLCKSPSNVSVGRLGNGQAGRERGFFVGRFFHE